MGRRVVIARFNETIGHWLLDGALDGLRRHGVADADLVVAWVPGAFESPLVVRRLAATRRYDAVICLGAVIRGATPHFDYVASNAVAGVAAAGRKTGVPAILGMLTTDTIEQAIERSGTKASNQGFNAAMAAIERVNLLQALPDATGTRQ